MEKSKISLFLTFTGKAEEAMRFYADNVPGVEITEIVRYGKDHPFAGEGEDNNVLHGSLSFMGQEIMFMDMGAAHPAPDFSWSSSIYIDCRDEAEFDIIFGVLSRDGFVMMGPESVGQIRKCAWVTDKYGVTWQPVWK
jgi:predicted 3-demethylubiquinone-9 3-methyltransferase (glyoxalase superfamily)